MSDKVVMNEIVENEKGEVSKADKSNGTCSDHSFQREKDGAELLESNVVVENEEEVAPVGEQEVVEEEQEEMQSVLGVTGVFDKERKEQRSRRVYVRPKWLEDFVCKKDV
ncbi:hypothetical protein NDU88_010397 [Pleurodeles waltl]|uniref:Uncharacterized protein n=1 Tax=Pleurodeles waltl TaxID=8319 RepID=A0AAV7PXT0_PLEWA|nr:hypothetical protein NDU88_010397 [Pleurodeles waltl]